MDASPPRIPTPALIDLIGNRVSLDDPILLVASMAEQLQARSVAELNAVVADAVDKISAASFQANTDAQRRSEAIITKATSFAAGHIREAGTAAAKTLTDKLEGQIDAVYQTSRRATIAAWISGACAVSAALMLAIVWWH